MLRSFHALHLCLQNACCDQKVSTMRLSGKYEAPENCSLTYSPTRMVIIRNPPHRFDPLYLAVTKQPRQSVLAVSLYGAGDGNRTRVLGLGNVNSTVRPQNKIACLK